jgi:hypothetical protein
MAPLCRLPAFWMPEMISLEELPAADCATGFGAVLQRFNAHAASMAIQIATSIMIFKPDPTWESSYTVCFKFPELTSSFRRRTGA